MGLLRSTSRFCGGGAFGFCELPPVFPTLAPLASAKHTPLSRRRRLWLLRSTPNAFPASTPLASGSRSPVFPTLAPLASAKHPPLLRRRRLWLLRAAPRVSDVGAFGFCDAPPAFAASAPLASASRYPVFPTLAPLASA